MSGVWHFFLFYAPEEEQEIGVPGKVSQYMDSRGGRFYATSKPMLDILLRELFTRKPRVVKITYR